MLKSFEDWCREAQGPLPEVDIFQPETTPPGGEWMGGEAHGTSNRVFAPIQGKVYSIVQAQTIQTGRR